LDQAGRSDVTLIITGGLRTAADFVKALALGADAIAVSNAAMQAIGCIAMRACHTNHCPVGIATQKPHLVQRLVVDKSATQLANFFSASVELMKVMARACGHQHLREFCLDDLTTWDSNMAALSGVPFGGVHRFGVPNANLTQRRGR
jgi:glutamate synthase domain-containing protein 2